MQSRDFKEHDRLIVVHRDQVAKNAPRNLKSKNKSILRDRLYKIVKEEGGGSETRYEQDQEGSTYIEFSYFIAR